MLVEGWRDMSGKAERVERKLFHLLVRSYGSTFLEVQTIHNCSIVTVSFFYVRVSRSKVRCNKAKGSVVILKAYCHSAFIPRHAAESSLQCYELASWAVWELVIR